jgi:hypothetical protein
MKASVKISIVNNDNPYVIYHLKNNEKWFISQDGMAIVGKYYVNKKMLAVIQSDNSLPIYLSIKGDDLEAVGAKLHEYRISVGLEKP